jgi:hypothetical protein
MYSSHITLQDGSNTHGSVSSQSQYKCCKCVIITLGVCVYVCVLNIQRSSLSEEEVFVRIPLVLKNVKEAARKENVYRWCVYVA